MKTKNVLITLSVLSGLALTVYLKTVTRIPHSCQVVTAPDHWTMPRNAAWGYRFEVRRTSDGFAIALKSGADGTENHVYSAEKYSFQTTQLITLRAISNDVWESAARLSYPGEATTPDSGRALNPCSFGDCGPTGNSLHFSGKYFQASGKRIESFPQGAILSADGRWLMLQSCNWPPTNHSFLMPDIGSFFIDLYGVSSGHKQFTVRTWHWGDNDPGSETRWISARHLFLDLSQNTKDFIICDATK